MLTRQEGTTISSLNNLLLRCADAADLDRLRPHLTKRRLELREMLNAAGTAVEHIYFVEHGVVSVVAKTDGRTAEIGIIGYEGVTGIESLLGDDRSCNDTYVQVSGEAWQIATNDLLGIVDGNPNFRALLLR